jgi:hypothetical protein
MQYNTPYIKSLEVKIKTSMVHENVLGQCLNSLHKTRLHLVGSLDMNFFLSL